MKNRFSLVTAVAATSVMASQPVQACMTDAPRDLNAVRSASVVLIGTIGDYRIVRDMGPGNRRLPPEKRTFYPPAGGGMSDYARFTIRVHRVLVGKTPARLIATWDASTSGEWDTMPPGPHLIALTPPSLEPGAMTVLQGLCSGAFIFPSTSGEARTIGQILKRRAGRRSPKSR